MKKLEIALVGAGSRGRHAYSSYALKHPNKVSIVAVAEPDDEKRMIFAKEHGISDDMCFKTWDELFEKEKFCDAVMICTQDDLHWEPAMAAIERAYDILLEKPISNNLEKCLEIEKAAREKNVSVMVCHVLRYTPFFKKLKKIVKSKEFGEIVTINHVENVGFWHQAHSYVRGNWNNDNSSSPMILAKSCHDIDIINWLVDSKCTSVVSFGSLKHFKSENAPKGSAKRCSDGCGYEPECPYSAYKIYLGNDGWPTNVITCDVSTKGILEAIEKGPYGRCVYHCDNNVVDNQITMLEYENSTTVNFTMCAFNDSSREREINIMCTHGQITGYMGKGEILTNNFSTGEQTVVKTYTGGGHGGGDEGIMTAFVNMLGGNKSDCVTSISDSVQSHVIAFAAEQSRKSKTIIKL